MSQPKLQAENFFVARTPRMPKGKLFQLSPTREATRSALLNWVSEPEVLDALYLASPTLHEQIDRWKKDPTSKQGQKIEQSLLKYMIRMTTRPTPFGLFAGVHAGQFADHTDIRLSTSDNCERNTRLDMFYLSAVRQHAVSNEIRSDRLRYMPNPSHYFVSGQCRYIETYQSDKTRYYRLSAADSDEYFQHMLRLAEQKLSFHSLTGAFIADYPEADRDTVEAYVEQLIAEGLLVADLPLSLTGNSPDAELVSALRGIKEDEIAGTLEQALSNLGSNDQRGGSYVAGLKSIAEELGSLPIKIDEGKLFQSDAYMNFEQCRLSSEDVAPLTDILGLLVRLGHAAVNPFADFVNKFNARFEGQFVPLSLLLDDETGISFSRETGYETPLLAGLNLAIPSGSPAPAPRPSPLDNLVMKAITSPENQGKAEILLDIRDLRHLAGDTPAENLMPASFGVLTSIYRDEKDRLLFHYGNSYGPSSAKIVGRFCHLNGTLLDGVRSNLEREEKHSPEVIFAEIAHVPEGRPGNVIARPHMRDYEIVFMADSKLSSEYQIPVSDLYVWVEAGQPKLWSKRLGRQIVPRLSCAHNYSSRSLSIYTFLCAMQRLAGALPEFHLPAALSNATFVPRISVGSIILSEKKWRIPRKNFADASGPEGLDLAKLAKLREKYQLDETVAFAVGDNVLYLNLSNPAMFDILLAETKRWPIVELQEALGSQYRTPFSAPCGDSYQNEVVVPYFNGAAKPHQTFRTNPQSHIEPSDLQRKFAPGSEWMSLKLYSGNSVIEDILLQKIFPMIEGEAASYQKWFFMRYGDPDWHIRLRFLGEPHRLYGELLPKLNSLLAPLIESGELHKMELFTYDREMERYGGASIMETAESFFMEDSRLVSKALQHLDDMGESLRWRLCLSTTNALLDLLEYDTDDKLRLITQIREGFGHEFNEDVSLRKKLGLKYRTVERTLWADLDTFPDYAEKAGELDGAQALIFPLIDEWRARIQPHCQSINQAYSAPTANLSCTKDSLIGSLLHMHNNRLFKAYGRQQELLMHDFLRRALYSRNQIGRKATGTH